MKWFIFIEWRFLKPTINNKRWGYNYISLQENWVKRKNWLLHRLVMLTFTWIKEWLEINHIDWDKSNNSFSNLEWVTSSENNFHKYNVLWIKHTDKQKESARINWENTWKKVWMFDNNWNLINEFSSAKKAWKFVWRTWSAICYCCNWITKESWWYKWKYL